jgi:hypothetical protein
MRLHTRLTADDIYAALQRAKDAGHIAPAVEFNPIFATGSQTHPRAYEISLTSPEYVPLPEPVNRYGRVQKTRRRARNGGWAATWREWGWFMAELFVMDPDSRWGTRPRHDGRDNKRWGYFNEADFHSKTNQEFTLTRSRARLDGHPWERAHP